MKNFNTTYPGHQSSQSMAADVKLEDCGQITSNSSGENKSTLEHSQNQPVPLFLDPLSLQSRLSFLPGLDSNGGVSPTRTQLTHYMEITELSYLTKMMNFYIGLFSQEKIHLLQKLQSVETELEKTSKEAPKDQETPQKKKRRMRRYAHQIHRVYQCPTGGCSKSYGLIVLQFGGT